MKTFKEIEVGGLFRDLINYQYIKISETLIKNIDTGSIEEMFPNELVATITIDDIKE